MTFFPFSRKNCAYQIRATQEPLVHVQITSYYNQPQGRGCQQNKSQRREVRLVIQDERENSTPLLMCGTMGVTTNVKVKNVKCR